LSSHDLLAGRIEVEIEHRSQIYRLRATASGKLILTK
jgi:hemin uptake protein HemP